ncbi:MAG: 3-keto-5-aminohexanoate cleavage protein, partial [Rhodospirillum sp.]|nr:3-keto-5-aminohexanoate cleavage protein [Rhodospirillum sp.]
DAEAYREAILAIRGEVGQEMVIQITTEAVGIYSPDEQRAVVREVRPEAVSLALKEMVPDATEEGEAAAFYEDLRKQGILMQHILYSPKEVARFWDLRARGVLPGGRAQVLFVLGRYAKDLRSDPVDLLPFLEAWGEGDGCGWSVCAFGPREAACMGVAAGLGGHARVGFENNLWRPDGTFARDNAELVATAVSTGAFMGRAAASADAARSLISP